MSLDLSQPFPMDASWKQGKLASGFTYFVRRNPKPAQRAELRLVVKAGSVLETDEERGVAHICEHLAFRHTENFDKFRIVQYLESIGAQFGPCQNAYTTFDETVYELHVPIDKTGLLEESLTVLHQFATSIVITDEDVEKERKIVLEEWRQRRTGQSRQFKKMLKDMLHGSKYASRVPIGTRKIIETVPASTVRSFYERWYHPERMAVVCVGDFDDESSVVAMIEAIFGSKMPASPPHELPDLSMFPHSDGIEYVIDDDDENTTTSVLIASARRYSVRETLNDFRTMLIEKLFHNAFVVRLQKVAVAKNPPYLSGECGVSSIVPHIEHLSLSAMCNPGGLLIAIEELLRQLRCLQIYGFLPEEIDMCKSDLLTDWESLYRMRDQQDSSELCPSAVSHFCFNEPLIGVVDEVTIGRALLASITAAEVSAVAHEFDMANNVHVRVLRPTAQSSMFRFLPSLLGSRKTDVTRESEETVEDVQRLVERILSLDPAEISKWHQVEVPAELLAEPQAGTVVERRTLTSEHGGEMTEVVMSNGVTICIKPTAFLDDDIRFYGVALGGTSEVGVDHQITSRHSVSIAEELGVFGFSNEVFTDICAGHRANVVPSVSLYTRYFAGETSVNDLEFALRLVHLLFTATSSFVVDPELVSAAMGMLYERAVNQTRDPVTVFSQRNIAVNTGNSRFFASSTPADIRNFDVEAAIRFYCRCFSDPAEFKLVFVGSIDVDNLLDLCERYIASIPRGNAFYHAPSDGSRFECAEATWSFPSKRVEESLCLPMVQPFGCAQLTFPFDIPNERKLEDSFWLETLCDVINRRLLLRLRFSQSAVYNVDVGNDAGPTCPRRGSNLRGMMYIFFSCDPAQGGALCDIARDEIRSLATAGPSEEEIQAVIETNTRSFQESLQQNDSWLSWMVQSYMSSRNDRDVARTYDEWYDMRSKVMSEISAESIRSAIQRIFPDDTRYTQLTLAPAMSRIQKKWVAAGSIVCLGAVVAAAAAYVWWKRGDAKTQ